MIVARDFLENRGGRYSEGLAMALKFSDAVSPATLRIRGVMMG
jgi:hypothetical protein